MIFIKIVNRRNFCAEDSILRTYAAAEEDVLTRLIRSRFQRLIAQGELKRIGPRNWRWRYPEFYREE